MRHAQAALELLQRPGFPLQLPAGQNLRSVRAQHCGAPDFQLRPCVSEMGAQCMPGRGVCQVSLCPEGCVHFLVSFGCSSLVWFCVMMGNAVCLASCPVSAPQTPTDWRAIEGYLFPGLCQAPFSSPTCSDAPSLSRKEDQSPRPTSPSDSGCVYTVPLTWGLSCHDLCG